MKAFYFLQTIVFFLCANNLYADNSKDLPRFFTVVENEVYRGAQPTDQGIQLLQEMKIRTVISLRNESSKQIQNERAEVQSLGMNFISAPMSGIFSPSEVMMKKIEQTLEDPAAQPVFVHCLHGEDRTGLVIGLYRVEHQNMDPKAAFKEMIKLGFHKILFGLDDYFDDHTGYED